MDFPNKCVQLQTLNFAFIIAKSADPDERVFVSYKRKYVHALLVIHLFKPAQEKECSGELTVPQ